MTVASGVAQKMYREQSLECAMTLVLLRGANPEQSRYRKQSLECAMIGVAHRYKPQTKPLPKTVLFNVP